jgi:hypothetical protein
MLKKALYSEYTLKIFFTTSLVLVFLDSYQIFDVPLSWIGSGFILIIFIYIGIIEKIKPNQLIGGIIITALVPTLINLFGKDYDLGYLILRVFSFVSFILIMCVVIKSKRQSSILISLKNAYIAIGLFSIYAFMSQIFNFFEPFRNRPGTGILGYDIQSNFWISGSHRMVGTFREPIFLVSILFPAFLILHYKIGGNKLFYLLSGVFFGLTKSELALIYVFLFIAIDFLINKIDLKVIYFLTLFLITFLVPIKECDISPSNIECPKYEANVIVDTTEENTELEVAPNSDTSKISPVIELVDKERKDIFSFVTHFLKFGTGNGFQNTNNIYTNYLSTQIKQENYLVNRTSPKYLETKYLSKNFGTGRYFLIYENINIQNNFLFNLFSIGHIYGIFLFLIILSLISKNIKQGAKVTLLIIIISLSSFEDLLPIFGLFLGLIITKDKYEAK